MALLAGAGELLEPLAGALRARGWTVHTGREVPEGTERLDLVVDCVEADGHEAQLAALRETLLLAGRTQPLLERAADQGRAAFVTVTRLDGRLGLSGTAGVERAALGGVTGLVKTLAIEAPALFCRALDLAPGLTAERCAEAVLAELYDAERALTEVGRTADGERVTVALADEAADRAADGTGPSLPGEPGAGEPGAGDLLVVTGGARGVTASCVLGLARRHRTGLLLLGRTPLGEEPAWAAGVAEAGLRAAAAAELKRSGAKPSPRAVEAMAREVTGVREIRGTLEALRAAGAEAEYLAVDVSDADAVREALAPHRARVTGVVHGAGVLADGLVRDKKAGDVDRVLATKLTGLRNVLGALDADAVRHVVLFSSVAGFFGNRGQSDYAMANEALNRWACALRARAPRARVTSVNWGAWRAAWSRRRWRRCSPSGA